MMKNKVVTLLILLHFAFLSHIIASDDGVKIKARQAGEYVIVDGVNENPFSITVAYNANFTNLKSEKKLPILFVLKAHSKDEVLKLYIEKKDFTFKANYEWTIGSKDTKHDDSYIYRLPYKLATKQMVSQGYNGQFSPFIACSISLELF